MIKKLVRNHRTRMLGVKFSIFALVGSLLLSFAPYAQAAQVTSLADTLSRLKASTAANHTIYFVTPTGLTAGQTITLTFSSDFTGVSSIAFGDVDFATGSTGVCSSATFTEQTLAASPSGATWGIGASGQVVTITSGTGTVTAARCVRILIGTNASTGTTGTNQISNGAADDDDTLTIGGTFGDSGTLTYDIISDDQVSVTATVDPTLSFVIDDNAIGFGSLSSSAARWANAAATGSASDTNANSFSIGTNAQSGYVLSYNGATLTSGSNTITVASITDDPDGTQNSEQFGIGVTSSGGSTVATGYDHNATAGNRDWAFVAGTTTTIVSRTTPVAADTINIYYLANISAATEAGSYSTTITYICTGTF